jgi:hypothetical protein
MAVGLAARGIGLLVLLIELGCVGTLWKLWAVWVLFGSYGLSRPLFAGIVKPNGGGMGVVIRWQTSVGIDLLALRS